MVGNYIQAPNSFAEDVSTPFGIAGTVVLVQPSLDYNDRCNGVAIARDKVITSPACANEWAIPIMKVHVIQVPDCNLPPGECSPGIPAPPELSGLFGVTSIETNDVSIGRYSVLTLDRPIPEAFMKHVAPVFTGHIESALRAGVLDDSNTLFAATRSWNSIPGQYFPDARTIGAFGVPLKVGYFNELVPGDPNPEVRKVVYSFATTEPWAAPTGDPSVARPWLHDNPGVPFFVWNNYSQRYELLGLSGYYYEWSSSAPWFHFRVWFHHLGRLNESIPNLFAYNDDDGDGAWDDWDNCPASECYALGLPALACKNSDQKNDDGQGLGDACRCLGVRLDRTRIPRNSNHHAEFALDVESLPNACDPTPLMTLSGQYPVLKLPPGNQMVGGTKPQETLGGLKWSTQRMC